MLKTLLQLRTSARQRADKEDDGDFISDSELNDYINESITSLYDLIISADNSKLLAVNAPTLTKVGDNSYDLPSDFYRLVSVHQYIGDRYYTAIPADPEDYPILAANPPHESMPEYMLRVNQFTGEKQLFIFPAVSASNLAVTYIPLPTTLVSDMDTFDGLADWHEYVVVDAAIKCLQKEESDTSAYELRRQQLITRIQNNVRDIDQASPKQIRDVAGQYDRVRRWLHRF